MNEYLPKGKVNGEENISPDFDINTGKSKIDINAVKSELVKGYHPDMVNGDEEMMKKINIAYEKGDKDFILKALEILRANKKTTEEDEEYLHEKEPEIREMYEDSPEEAEEVISDIREGNIRAAVDSIIDRLRKTGRIKSVFLGKDNDPNVRIYRPKNKVEEAEGENLEEGGIREEEFHNFAEPVRVSDIIESDNSEEGAGDDSAQDKLRRVNEMMRQINETKGSEEKRESGTEPSVDNKEDNKPSAEEISPNEVQLESLDTIDKSTVSFGKKKKEKVEEKIVEKVKTETLHKNLKEWSAKEVKNDPSTFIGDVLHNIDSQIMRGGEFKLPNKALGIVLQLLERSYKNSDEKDKEIIDGIRDNFYGDDIDSLKEKLRFAEDYFRVDKVFKSYIKESKKKESLEKIKSFNFGEKEKEVKEKLEAASDEIKEVKSEEVKSDREQLLDSVNDIRSKIEKSEFGEKNILSRAGMENSIDELLARRRREVKPLEKDTLPKITIKDIPTIEEKEIPKKTFEQVRDEVTTKKGPLEEGVAASKREAEIEKTVEPIEAENIGNVVELQKTETQGERKSEKEKEKELKPEDEVENKKRKERYLEMVKELVDFDIKLDGLKKERIRKETISERLGVKDRNESELEKEYKKVRQDYVTLRRKLSKEAGYSEEEIDEKIISLRKEIGERKSRFNKEKAVEYIQHLKKIVEYQKESLPKNKKELFEKIVATAKDKKVQTVMGAMLLGISITVPEVGGAAWLTHGLVEGFLPAELGMPLKYFGVAAGGYLMGEQFGATLNEAYKKILDLRKGKIAEIEKKMAERASKLVSKKNENVSEFKSETNNIRSASFFNKFDESRIRNNFIESKKQILES